jgi:uncharacterized protein (DUF1330 family)
MAAYVLVQVNVTKPEQYDVYKPLAAAAVQKHGGKYIVRGGAAEDLEGSRPFSRIVVLEFPSVAQAKAWYGSAEYQAAKAARAGAGTGVFTVIEGV